MTLSADVSSRRLLPRALVTVGIVAAGLLVRQALDPFLGEAIPYLAQIPAVVLASWLYGVRAGLVSTALSALLAEYLFVVPRHQLMPSPHGLVSIALFCSVGAGLVWLVGRLKAAETTARELHAQATAVLQQLPVGVAIADAARNVFFGNAAMDRIFGRPFVPTPVDSYEQEYRFLRPDGHPLPACDYPISRSLRSGETVTDTELHVELSGDRRKILNVSSAPLRSESGALVGAVATMVDITEQREGREIVRQRAEELQAILDTAPAAVFVTRDPYVHHVEGNRTAAGLFGAPSHANFSKTPAGGEPIVMPFTTRAGREIPADELPLQAAMRANGPIVGYEFDIPGEHGVRTLYGNATPLRDPAGRVRGAVGTFVDITEKARSEEALREANRVKDEFFATLSHELRTPLNAIVGWSDMLRRGALEGEAAKQAFESIYRNAKAQSEMINDALDVSRIISGKVRVDLEAIDARAVIDVALDTVRPTAVAKGVHLRADFSPMPVPVFGDAARLRQVFWNLFSNAVKFTPPGGTVRASLEYTGETLTVRVSDTGIGIAPDFLPHVFDRFRQSDSSTTRTHMGLGLGLAIVRHIVELHGGRVKVESAGLGRGATFTVTLPGTHIERRHGAPAVVRPLAAVETSADQVPSLGGLRVLVVDDQVEAREVAGAVLRQYGATVALAANAAQAEQLFDLFDPNVLLLDIAMPETDGFALLQHLRKSCGEKGARVPAIALTALTRDKDREQALASGFQLHIAKPVDSHTLVRAIDRVRTAGPQVARI